MYVVVGDAQVESLTQSVCDLKMRFGEGSDGDKSKPKMVACEHFHILAVMAFAFRCIVVIIRVNLADGCVCTAA